MSLLKPRSRTISVLSFLLLFSCSGFAWGTSASIFVSGNEGAIPLEASATFNTYLHCAQNEPSDCSTNDFGKLRVYQGSVNIGVTSGNGSVTWSTTLNGGALSQGDHIFTATAVDSEGVSNTASKTITIDNTPTVTVESPGQVEGGFEIRGTATFKEYLGGQEGKVRLLLDRNYSGWEWYEGTSVNWRYPFAPEEMLDAGAWGQGEHTIKVYAKAANGAESPVATSTFTIDNTPSVTLENPGQVEGGFEIRGTVAFKEYLGGQEGKLRVYLDGKSPGWEWYEGTSVNWRYPFAPEEMLDAGAWDQGEHTIEVYARAANGAESPVVTGMFEVASLTKNKNLGPGSGNCETRPLTKNPINFSTGNKFLRETDLTLEGPGLPMGYVRYYNSQSERNGPLGYGWSNSFSQSLSFPGDRIILLEAGGQDTHFLDDGQGRYVSETDEIRIIEPIEEGHTLTEPDGRVFTFDVDGKLTRITDRNGNTQALTYDSGNLSYVEDNYGRRFDFGYDQVGHLTTLTTAAGLYTYTYDNQGNLKSVTNPGMTGKTYLYEDPNDPHNLTGVINENGIRSETAAYDDQDRAVLSEKAGGTKGVHVSYDNNFVRHLIDSLGRSTTFKLQVAKGMGRVRSSTGSGCGSCLTGARRQHTFGDRFQVVSARDANGNITAYTYDDRGNMLTKTEAFGTPEERTTTFTHHPDLNLITSINKTSVSIPGQTTATTFTYDSRGNLLEKKEAGFSGGTSVSKTTTYNYNSLGQLISIDGPRTDVSDIISFEYYPNDPSQGLNRGMLRKIIDPMGYEKTFSHYNAYGRPEQSIDTNGVFTTDVYDSVGRLISRTTAGYTTAFEYDGAGNLTSVHLPGGRALFYKYTVADLLEEVEDNSGNSIRYVYDTEGNRVREEIKDSGGVLRKYADFTFDALNRLSKTIYPGGDYEASEYDGNGNLVSKTDANGRATQYEYDPLNRLRTTTQPGNTVTSYTYDSHDNLTGVTDANNHITTYVHDDLGLLGEVASPDTGTTVYTYDTAGNLVAKSDANGNTISYTYDELNRLTGIHFSDTAQDISYTYDQGTNGKGRLTGMTDPTGSYVYGYNALGQLETEDRILDDITFTTSYAYDPSGFLVSITYPSGRVVSYQRDGTGNLTRVTTTKEGETKTLVENMTHLPFGPVTGMAYGNGITLTQGFDQLYRLTDLHAGIIEDLTYSRDPMGNVLSITDNLEPAKNQDFSYDNLYRLASADGIQGNFAYTYDKVGNRLTRTTEGETDTYSYAPGRNRLLGITGANPLTFSHDANGNITAMGNRTLIYNQNNRLIRVTENGNTLGEYLYNGRGERTRKTSDQGTVYFLYDKDGNLIAETDSRGNIQREYIYADGMRLAMIQTETVQDIRIEVATSKGRYLSGIKVYAFNGSGNYTGQHAVTDNDGVAIFPLENFSAGTYSFRADYLGFHFWSQKMDVPGTLSAQVIIEEENAEVEFTVAGTAQEGVKVYLFDKGGKYLGLYGTTDGNGKVSFLLPSGQEFKFRGDYLSTHYWSEPAVIEPGQTTQVIVAAGGGLLTVTVQKEPGVALTGLKLYLFSQTDAYLGRSGTTDDNGQAVFAVSGGSYQVRADYMGYKFWTEIIPVNSDTVYALTIPHRDVTGTVIGDFNSDLLPFEGLNVYLFTPAGAYLGITQKTDQEGKVIFNLPPRDFMLRADYLKSHYWSDVIMWENTTLKIPEGYAEVTATGMGLPLEDIRIYVFNPQGSYLHLNDTTGSEGMVRFRLPAGEYNFRADFMGSHYWSGNTTLIPHISNPVTVSTGGGSFTLIVLDNQEFPLQNVPCYLFSTSGSYLGAHGVTNSQGEVDFNLSDGAYKIRINYLGYQFWTEPFTLPGSNSLTMNINHSDVKATVSGDFSGDVVPFPNVKVYLFTPSGSYLRRSDTSDGEGMVMFKLPDRDFKVRADYLRRHYWSEVFNGQDTSIMIHEGLAEVLISQGQKPLPDVNVYVFSDSGAYLGIKAKTDAQGLTTFRLPEGTYKFRADFQGNHYWATEPVEADLVNTINLNTGGGNVGLTLNKGQGMPLIDIPIYVFTRGGAYLGLTSHTSDQGLVSFDLADGSYKFRANYLGYQFWSDPFDVPQSLSQVLTIPHQDVTVTVNKVYGNVSTPLEGIKTYLFNEKGAYQKLSAYTDVEGSVTFNLPMKSYQIRADYLKNRYWSEALEWQDGEINIEHGLVRLHVTKNGSDLLDVPVYLFSDRGAYLGKSQRTDGFGEAVFTIPAKSYKFRLDYNSAHYWSDIINVIPNKEIEVSLDIDPLALNSTNNPHPTRFDGTPPLFKPDKIQVASVGSLAGILLNSLMAQVPEERVYYFINDHLGTPLKLMDENGQVVWSADYQPFGEAEISTQAVTNNFRFPGQYYDGETGLHYNYHRYYDTGTGRYIRTDPIGLAGGISLYFYVLNNPISFVDPYGLIHWRTVGKGTASVIFGLATVVGGAFTASTPTGVGQVLGVAGVLAGSSSIGFGVSQIIAGFMENELPFMGIKEAVIQETTSGFTQINLLAANELLDMIPDIASGRMNIKPSRLGEAVRLIQYGASIGKSGKQIQKELEETGLLESIPCK